MPEWVNMDIQGGRGEDLIERLYSERVVLERLAQHVLLHDWTITRAEDGLIELQNNRAPHHKRKFRRLAAD